ncbi:MAG: hypothetical protein QHH07_08910 [Sedimentisphaerales bacterium]|nr:hypothetical protein [Sedimentisphaerales bacterium]
MKRPWLLLLICLGLYRPCPARMTRQQILDLFNQANSTFRAANQEGSAERQKELYHQAALAYQKIISDGQIRNARLYYNLANAYLLSGDIGRAIVNYRRAEILDRTNPNIQKNLAFARSKRIDQVSPGTQQQVLAVLFFWHFDLPIGTKVWVASCAFGVLYIALTIMVWLGRSALCSSIASIGLIVALAMVGSVLVEQHQLTHRRFGVIIPEQVVARQGDGPGYPEAFKAPLHAGTEFELIEARPGSYHIRLADGSEGWIPEDAAELI